MICSRKKLYHQLLGQDEQGRVNVESSVATTLIILMDLKMPGMSGFEATRILRQRGTTTPIIAITALVFQDDQLDLIAAGMNGGLQKPVTPKALWAIIDETIKS